VCVQVEFNAGVLCKREVEPSRLVYRLEEAPRRVREGEVAVDVGGETRDWRVGRPTEGLGLMRVCFGIEGQLELLVGVLNQSLGKA
jgi:hypothetical protein